MFVLVVEDEALQRRALEQMIRHACPEADVEGCADGLQALAVAAQRPPDAVFLDIQMPRLGGLETAKRLREMSPAAVLFVLTAYEHFAYAQQAIGLGIDEYLLKPVGPADIQRCLQMAAARMRSREEDQRRQGQLREALADAMPLLRSQFAADLCSGAITSPGEYRRRAGLLGLSAHFDLAVSITIAARTPDAGRQPPSQDGDWGVERELELELGRRAALTAIEAAAAAAVPQALAGRIAHDELVLLIESSLARTDGRKLTPVLRRLAAVMIERCRALEFELAVGLGGQVAGPLAIWRSYRAAARARQRAWLLGPSGHRVVSAADLGDDVGQWEQYPLLAERGLAAAVRSGLPGQAREYLAPLTEYFLGGGSGSPGAAASPAGEPASSPAARVKPGPALRSRAVECLALLSRAAGEGGLPPAVVLDCAAQSVEKAVRAATAGQLAAVISETAEDLATGVAQHHDQRQSGLAARAAAYLKGHFPSPISLTTIAAELHVSPFYLSHTFHQSLGVTFSEYLTGLRISEAQRLLVSTGLPVGEIAARVGYREANYFGRVFKKVTGQTPLAWRRRA